MEILKCKNRACKAVLDEHGAIVEGSCAKSRQRAVDAQSRIARVAQEQNQFIRSFDEETFDQAATDLEAIPCSLDDTFK